MAIQAQLCSDNFGFSFGGPQNWMDSGYGFNESFFDFQQKQSLLLQKPQIPCFQNTGLLSNHKNDQDLGFSSSVFALIEKQRQEVDRFIRSQNERLKLAFEEQRKQQILLLLRKYEAKAEYLLKQKDEELSKAMNRTGELEEFLRRIEIENQNWQRLATENEAMVSNLNNSIEQLRENQCFTNWAEDAESCCDEETGESRGQDIEEEQKTRTMLCKCCGSRNSCVVFLPCRCLCSCKSCQGYLNSCPVCGVVKKASIEALI